MLNKLNKIYTIQPNWQAPKHIKAFTTLAMGGYSNNINHDLYSNSFNLGLNVDIDNANITHKNRELLIQQMNCHVIWLNQVHGTYCINIDDFDYVKNKNIQADASFTTQKNIASSVLTADCLPVLVTDKQGTAVLAIHAGWKGLVNGIIEKSIEYFIQQTKVNSEDILVWLSAAIGAQSFEVGAEVVDTFINYAKEHEKQQTIHCFAPSEYNCTNNIKNAKFFADIYALAKVRLSRLQIPLHNISGGDFCTYSDTRFFSYRRNNIGRMASVIYII